MGGPCTKALIRTNQAMPQKKALVLAPIVSYSQSGDTTTLKLIRLGSASITGGYFYRSQTDPCLYGRYLYIDLYPDGIWPGTENPENSRNFTSSKIQYRCAQDSPIHCESIAEGIMPAIGYVFSLGEDSRKDLYIDKHRPSAELHVQAGVVTIVPKKNL